MVLPIVAYGDSVLKKKAIDIKKNYPELKKLISNMFKTMYAAQGVGLAAPQVGLSIRLFIIDTFPFSEDESLSDADKSQLKSFKKTFINPEIVEENGSNWNFNEGCLSIPNVREEITRKSEIKIRYLDENFKTHIDKYDGLVARVIQHEYDHIEGVLFTDKVSNFKKRLIKSKLKSITLGKVDVNYAMRFPRVIPKGF
tara:strand:+ start:21055 stop:21648 length:594 start_codon:yes stop_codon:yes gene_type:complete